MSHRAARHAIIIGGGASGVLLAYQLLQNPDSDFRVTLIERRPEIGRGLAYHTGNPEHLLNVRVANMSALPEDPEHFWRWLTLRADGPPWPDPYCFVPRSIYGDYLASLIEPLASNQGVSRRLVIRRGECVEVGESPTTVTVTLADGTCHVGDVAIFATGHDTAASNLPGHADPWATPSTTGVGKDASVLISGTGLTMVDYVLSLLRDGHRGQIIAMSRRGLLAKAHRRVESIRIEASDVPFGTDASRLLRWFRERIDVCTAGDGDWRSVIDAVRPFTQRLWQELPHSSRRRFLEHARAWWDVHRHRMAPEVEMRIEQALTDGRLTLMAAKIVDIEPNTAGALVRYRRRGQNVISTIQIGIIVDCTGIVRNPLATTNPALRSLFDRGLARADPLHIGIEIAADCAIVDRSGRSSRRLFAVGPLTRAAFWEIIAIPDIRNQCAELAKQLIRSHQAAT